MTKKDYIAIARIIKNNLSTEEILEFSTAQSFLLLNPFMKDLCQFLKSDNPNFDEAKFRKAIS